SIPPGDNRRGGVRLGQPRRGIPRLRTIAEILDALGVRYAPARRDRAFRSPFVQHGRVGPRQGGDRGRVMTPEIAEQVQALTTAIEALDLSALEDIADTLDSRALRKIHRSLVVDVERVQAGMEELQELLEALVADDG